jgi:hypothetical protein
MNAIRKFMESIPAIFKKMVLQAFFKIITPRRIERSLQAQGYSRTRAREIISSFKKAAEMCIKIR